MDIVNLSSPWQEADLECLKRPKNALVIRYGGFGDVLQAGSILTPLKKEGWHVTVNTQEQGRYILKTDPRVDRILYQRRNQVPILELTDYVAHISQYFDRVINLSESVERRLLPVSGRWETINGEKVWVPPDEAFNWPHEKRHALLDRNYLAEIHRIAKVPFKPGIKFYPTRMETERAKKDLKDFGMRRVILWVLSGSSLHKAYLWMDNVLQGLFGQTRDVGVIMVGDKYCQILEQGWEEERRVLRKSGKWSIRRTLAMAQQVDLVIGPETGVLNAVSSEPVPKIVFLSHSSEENLTKHWVNTQVMKPRNLECWPCHQMHYSYCHNVEPRSGMAMCSATIEPSEVLRAIGEERKAA